MSSIVPIVDHTGKIVNRNILTGRELMNSVTKAEEKNQDLCNSVVDFLFKKFLHWDLKMKLEILLVLYPGLTFTQRQYLRALHGQEAGNILANITLCLEEERPARIDCLVEWHFSAQQNHQTGYLKETFILGRPETIPTKFASHTGQAHCDIANRYQWAYDINKKELAKPIETLQGADIKLSFTVKHAANKSVISPVTINEREKAFVSLFNESMPIKEVIDRKTKLYVACWKKNQELEHLIKPAVSYLENPNLNGVDAVDYMNKTDELIYAKAAELGLPARLNPFFLAIANSELSQLNSISDLPPKPELYQKPELYNNIQTKIKSTRKMIGEESSSTLKEMDSWEGTEWESAISKNKYIN